MNNDSTYPIVPPSPSHPTPHARKGLWQWFKAQKLLAKVLLVFGVFVLSMCTCCGGIAAYGSTLPPMTPVPGQKVAQTGQHTTPAKKTPQRKATVSSSPTRTPSPRPSPTPTPTMTPTSTPSPLPPTPTPIPTQPPPPPPPVVPTPVPTQPPPAPPPPQTGVNGNPWGYDFTPGSYIYRPDPGFCGYFNCISNFWNGNGYVMECNDGMYAKSGGLQGSCSRHGGNMRPLYAH